MIKMLQYKIYPAGELAVLRQLLLHVDNKARSSAQVGQPQYIPPIDNPSRCCFNSVKQGFMYVLRGMATKCHPDVRPEVYQNDQ